MKEIRELYKEELSWNTLAPVINNYCAGWPNMSPSLPLPIPKGLDLSATHRARGAEGSRFRELHRDEEPQTAQC